MPVTTRVVPDQAELTQVVDDIGHVSRSYDQHFYEKQVQRGAAWDTTYAFRLATAKAKDRARNQLARAVQLEARQAQWRAAGGLGGGFRDFNSVLGEAHAKVTRSVNGVEGASLDDIKL